jgi:hypothetical protein
MSRKFDLLKLIIHKKNINMNRYYYFFPLRALCLCIWFLLSYDLYSRTSILDKSETA